MNQEDNDQNLSTDEHEFNQSDEPEHSKLLIPFEDPSVGFVKGIWETIKLVIFKPTHFFQSYKLDGKIGKPILFAVIIGWISVIIGYILGIFMTEFFFSLFQRIRDNLLGNEELYWEKFNQLALSNGSYDFIIEIVLAPVGIIIGLFIVSGIYHIFLLLVKGANKSFATTFNVVAYGMTSKIAEILPFCGSFISFIYGIVLAIIGLSEGHKTESWKAVFAVFAPLIICIFCCILFFLFLGGSQTFLKLLEEY